MQESIDLDNFYARREKMQIATFVVLMIFLVARFIKLILRRR
jgi:hypothetical protein